MKHRRGLAVIEPDFKRIVAGVPEHTALMAYQECCARFFWLAERGFENSESGRYAIRLMQEYERRFGLT